MENKLLTSEQDLCTSFLVLSLAVSNHNAAFRITEVIFFPTALSVAMHSFVIEPAHLLLFVFHLGFPLHPD